MNVPFAAQYTENTPIVIRNMRLDDADFAGRMIVESFRSKMERNVAKSKIPGLIQSQQEYHRLVTDRYHRVFIAEYNGQRAGLVEIKIKEDNFSNPDIDMGRYIGCCAAWRMACLDGVLSYKVPPRQCYIDHICVDDQFRGKGIGKALLDKADEEGRRLGCARMALYVASTNRAKNLYLRHGYEIKEEEDGCCFTWCTTGIRVFIFMEKQL